MFHHNFDELIECRFRLPAEDGVCFRGIAFEVINFGRSEVVRINFHVALARDSVDAFFIYSCS